LGLPLVIVIGYRGNPSEYAIKLGERCGALLIEDTRADMSYAPSIQPHLLAKLCKGNANEAGPWLLIDSDVLLKEIPQEPQGNIVTGSDCGPYLNAAYVDGCDSLLLDKLCQIAGVSAEYVRERHDTPGAQYILPHLFDAGFWEKVESDSNSMYRLMDGYVCSIHEVQKWTASMWAFAYALYVEEQAGRITVETDERMKFAWATDPVGKWDAYSILHCAGVHKAAPGLFFKGAYVTKTPFTANLDHVAADNCSWIYAQAIQRYEQTQGGIYGRR
jgi:hypothetical protein